MNRVIAEQRKRDRIRAFGLVLGPGWAAGYLSGLWVSLALCGTAMLIGAPLWSLAIGIVGGTGLALVMLCMTGGAQ